jgi:hypothetical protein|tara:strand:+ start:102 stop:551 length:450 start_codon:yes stop_codon:yes gene_type:complete
VTEDDFIVVLKGVAVVLVHRHLRHPPIGNLPSRPQGKREEPQEVERESLSCRRRNRRRVVVLFQIITSSHYYYYDFKSSERIVVELKLRKPVELIRCFWGDFETTLETKSFILIRFEKKIKKNTKKKKHALLLHLSLCRVFVLVVTAFR